MRRRRTQCRRLIQVASCLLFWLFWHSRDLSACTSCKAFHHVGIHYFSQKRHFLFLQCRKTNQLMGESWLPYFIITKGAAIFEAENSENSLRPMERTTVGSNLSTLINANKRLLTNLNNKMNSNSWEKWTIRAAATMLIKGLGLVITVAFRCAEQ